MIMKTRALFHSIILAGVSQFVLANAFASSDDAVLRANALAGVVATKACIAPLNNPFHESRAYAMMHIAIHDALIAAINRMAMTRRLTQTLCRMPLWQQPRMTS
jgi:hypothetical protein